MWYRRTCLLAMAVKFWLTSNLRRYFGRHEIMANKRIHHNDTTDLATYFYYLEMLIRNWDACTSNVAASA